MTVRFCLLLLMAAFFCGASASINITTVAPLATDGNTSKPGSESPSTRPDTGLNSTTGALNTTTSTSSRMSSGTPTVRTYSTSPPTILSGASSPVRNVVVLILFFLFLMLLFFFAYKWYVRNGRPSSVEIGRRLVEFASNVWAAAAADLPRPSSKDVEEEHEDEAGIKTAEDQNNRGGDAEDDSDEDSSDYSNMGGAEWTKKAEDMDGQGNEGEDEMSSVELKDETERMKDNLTVL